MIRSSITSLRGNRLTVVPSRTDVVPLAVVLVAVFGKPHLIGTGQRWEAVKWLIDEGRTR
jgi:hypothetical protein